MTDAGSHAITTEDQRRHATYTVLAAEEDDDRQADAIQFGAADLRAGIVDLIRQWRERNGNDYESDGGEVGWIIEEALELLGPDVERLTERIEIGDTRE